LGRNAIGIGGKAVTVARVEVTGLRELLREARKVERDLPKAMRTALLPVSQEVMGRARLRAGALGGVHRHAARRGLRAGATQNTAWIKLVATTEPTILGAEFGGGARKTTRQFPPWRGAGSDAGYFVYPEIRGSADDVMEHVENAVEDLMRQAGFL
jgi:hypothetical protein